MVLNSRIVAIQLTVLLCVACDSEPEEQMSPDAGMVTPTPDMGMVMPTPDMGMAMPDMGPPPRQGVPALGNGTHDTNEVTIEVITSRQDGLNRPTDLEFHPSRPGQLWVVNQDSESMVVISDVGGANQTAESYWRPEGHHFMARPSSLAFGPGGAFATIHETADFTQGPPPAGTPEDFMGPTLWTDDLTEFDGGHHGHLDMLHNSPNGMGIAWETDNTYWVFDGYHSSLTRYAFNMDHGLGGSDHSDGEILRYVEGEVSRIEGVPSHMEIDHDTNMLYVADTGNNRIAMLDIASGSMGSPIFPNYDNIQVQRAMMGASLTTVVNGADFNMVTPSGLKLFDDLIFVTDNGGSRIYAFSRQGELVDWLDTGRSLGALMGIDIDAEGNIYLVDSLDNSIVRISAK